MSDSVQSVRYFNTSGPCLQDRHYLLPPQARLPEALRLIEEGRYFVVHAPRQSGKTTTLATLARRLTAEGEYLALRFSCERARGAGDDYEAAQRDILSAIRGAASAEQLAPELLPPNPWPEPSAGSLLVEALSEWAKTCPLPLVLFFDEIDALRGNSLISVLSQLRDGYTARPNPFPHSVVLCGLRDVRDYKAASGGDPERLGTASPFNIKAASLRLNDFSFGEVSALYEQHTAETGQKFTEQAVQRAFEASQGQPWLANALAYETTRVMDIAPPEPITDTHMEQAVERLIVSRATHLDSLVARLHEPRVQRIIEPLIAGELPAIDPTYDEDLSYLRDLGLISQIQPLQVANPIYQEVILRVLAASTESLVAAEPRSFVTADGRMDFARLLQEFAAFWRINGEILTSSTTYNEAACQLVFMGFLHRVINSGGWIDREYGRGRIDLLLRWPYPDRNGTRAWQSEAIELKVHHPRRPDPVPDGLAQLDRYLDRLGLDTGTLVVFDRRPTARPLPERTIITPTVTPVGRTITLLRA